jgi:hypothetical protein
MPETPSRRLSLHAPSSGDPADVPADIKRLRDQLDPITFGYAGRNTLALRPTFGTEGRLFFATDIGTLYYDTGSAWVAVPTFGRGVRPAAGVAGRLWEDTSTDAIYWDTGARWLTVVPPNGVRAQVLGSTDSPQGGNSYTLIPEMSIRGTFSGRPVQITFEATVKGPLQGGEVGGIQFVRNGSVIYRSIKCVPGITHGTVDDYRVWAATFVDLAPPTGSYAYEVFWGGAFLTAIYNYGTDRRFSVVELPSR